LKITFTEQEIQEYKKEFKNYNSKKVHIVFDKIDVFADIKMFQFLMAIESENVKILKMIPDREYLGKEDFSADLCNFTLSFFINNLTHSETVLKKIIEMHTGSLQDYSVNNVDIRDYSIKKNKVESAITLPEKFLTLVKVKEDGVLKAYLCMSIIKIMDNHSSIFWIDEYCTFGLMRYLDKSAPIVKNCENEKNKMLLLLNTGLNGILGIFIDEILFAKKINPNEISVDLNDLAMVYYDKNEKLKVIESNLLLAL